VNYAATYPSPEADCNNFRWAGNNRLDVGTTCSTQIQGTDVPVDPLWYAICHFTDQAPSQDANDTVHGHVNWEAVTYQGKIQL
jgi:hypothetical protein